MTRTRWLIILLSLLSAPHWLAAQENAKQEKQKAIARKFIEGYNKQNYAKMTRSWFFIAKLLPLKKALRKEYTPHFSRLGKVTAWTIQYPSDNKAIATLTYEKDTTQKDHLAIYFTKKNKIMGMGIKGPDFVYPKIQPKPGNVLSASDKSIIIDSLVMSVYLTDHFNGCVLVIDNGKVIYKNAYGYANYENKNLLNDSSVFYLASCSKQFTATAILMLAEQGKLKLSDTIQQYIPGLPYRNITIENLLTHTSGLPDYMRLMDKHWDKRKIANNDDVVSSLSKYQPKSHFSPGEQFEYSNTGYALLAFIVEKSSGMTYSEFMRKNIFIPIGMNHTYIGGASKKEGDKTPNWAYGHIYSDRRNQYVLPENIPSSKNRFYLDSVVGDGNVNTSVTDLVLWDKALRENKLVKKETLEKAYSKYVLKDGKESNYGYGVVVCMADTAEKLVWHTGGWTGYHTFMLRFLDQYKAVIILSNNEYSNFMILGDKIAKVIMNGK